MSRILNLHFQSEYSFFESPTKIKDYVNFAKENEAKTLVLTDHNNVHGFAEFKELCEQNNIKPIYGIDIDTNEGRLILLAKNFDGFGEIKRLAFIKSNDNEILISNINEENLFVIAHPNNERINILKQTFKYLYYYRKDDDTSNIFVKDTRIIDDTYLNSLQMISNIKKVNLDHDNDYTLKKYSINREDWIKNIEHIFDSCNVIFPIKHDTLPSLADDPILEIQNIIKTTINQLPDIKSFDSGVLKQRINYELSVLKKLNVGNYFLIIADLIKWAKSNDISIGPGRGSVCGSLVAYLLGITEINPLQFNLYFERFLNEERITMPDIDIDIQDDKRDDVLQYLKNKYGFDNIAQICTFQRLGAKQALKDCGKLLDINFARMNEITKLISGTDTLRDSYDNNIKFKSLIDSEEILTKLYEDSLLIESLPRQVGIHAAGIVISSKPIIDSIPIMEDSSKNLVTQFSMEHIENWNLLKIDLLGLRTLSIIKKMEDEIHKNFDPNFQFNKIPLNDEKTNRLLSSSKVLGIFQLESPGMMSTLKKVGIQKFSDLVDTISLFRPGPLTNISKYIENKNDPNNYESISREYDNIVKPTNGIIIYQEQIMEIIQKVAGLTFSKADILRRAISKKKLNDILEMKNIFLSGVNENKTPISEGEKIFDQIVKFAEYGFNKSHAVAYATISYRMAYIKTRFPLCFYIGLISATTSIDTINKSVVEARELKFIIESPSINKISNDIVHNKKNIIYLPLTFIKGLGIAANTKILNEFMEYGPFKDFFDFILRCKRAKITESIIDTLIESNALREFGNVNTLRNNKSIALSFATISSFENKETGEINLDFDVQKPKMQIFEQDIEEEAKLEIKYLGMIYNSFPTSKYESEDKLCNLKLGIEYKIIVIVNEKKQVLTKNKKLANYVEISDSSTKVKVWINEKDMNIYNQMENNKIGFVTILKLNRNEREYWKITKWEEVK